MGGGGGAVLVLSELEGMASRQQREIAQQRRLLEQREARLAVLRGAQVSEGERDTLVLHTSVDDDGGKDSRKWCRFTPADARHFFSFFFFFCRI